jgi:hypothetical protein
VIYSDQETIAIRLQELADHSHVFSSERLFLSLQFHQLIFSCVCQARINHIGAKVSIHPRSPFFRLLQVPHSFPKQAELWLEIARQLLAAHDLVRSKRFVERAMVTDPMLEGVDYVLVVADVLLASQCRIGPHHADWYVVLGVDPSTNEVTIKNQHHHLAMLLRPEVNSHAGAEDASHIVADELSFLIKQMF